MSAAQLELEVNLTGRDPYRVLTTLMDHNVWDMTRARNKWPTPNEAPLTWIGYLGWAASRRLGKIEPTMTWELFLNECLSVENLTGDDESAVSDPTQPVPGPG